MGIFKRIVGSWLIVALTAIAVLIMLYAFFRAEEHYSSDEFCVSCHSMSYPAAELRRSSHYGRLGFTPGCQDCHLPREFVPRMKAHVEEGVRDIISELRNGFSTKEKFEEKRAEMAHISRINLKKMDSSPCRGCHRAIHKTPEEAEAAKKDGRKDLLTCIDCHQNLVHGSTPAEDLNRSISEGRIVLR